MSASYRPAFLSSVRVFFLRGLPEYFRHAGHEYVFTVPIMPRYEVKTVAFISMMTEFDCVMEKVIDFFFFSEVAFCSPFISICNNVVII
jgi:hypothetical protein